MRQQRNEFARLEIRQLLKAIQEIPRRSFRYRFLRTTVTILYYFTSALLNRCFHLKHSDRRPSDYFHLSCQICDVRCQAVGLSPPYSISCGSNVYTYLPFSPTRMNERLVYSRLNLESTRGSGRKDNQVHHFLLSSRPL